MQLPRPQDYELHPCGVHGDNPTPWTLHMRRKVGNIDKFVCCVCAVDGYIRTMTESPARTAEIAHDAGIMRR